MYTRYIHLCSVFVQEVSYVLTKCVSVKQDKRDLKECFHKCT